MPKEKQQTSVTLAAAHEQNGIIGYRISRERNTRAMQICMQRSVSLVSLVTMPKTKLEGRCVKCSYEHSAFS